MRQEYQKSIASFTCVLTLGISAWLGVWLLHESNTIWLWVSWFGSLVVVGLALIWLIKETMGNQSAVAESKAIFVSRRRRVGSYLTLAVLGAFGSAYLMIPMYYWMSGGQGHVHGVVDLDPQSNVPVLTADQVADIYFFSDINTDKLPVRYSVKPAKLSLKPGDKALVTIDCINPLPKPVTYRIKAKVAPGIAAPYLHYDLEDQVIHIPAKGSQQLQVPIHLMQGLPLEAKTVTISHFLFSGRQPEDWRKMTNAWNPAK